MSSGSAVTIELTNIKNPTVSGSTGTYTIRTKNASGDTIDQDTSVTAGTITPGALTSTNVQPESLEAKSTGDVDVSFTLANPLATGGKVVIIFPSVFTLSSGAATGIGGDGTSFDGTETVTVSGNSVTVTRSGGSQVSSGTAVTLELTNIKNPTVSGSHGAYTIKTANASGTTIDQDTAVTADTFTIPPSFTAGDYVLFAQARDGTAAETSDNGSNDSQVSVSGSDNHLFGRIRSNADFESGGSGGYYHFKGNGPTKPVAPSTVNDGKVTFRFQNSNGSNFYESPLSDSVHSGDADSDGTWLPVKSAVPVGPVTTVTTTPSGDDYQFWPGNLHTAVTAASKYLEMDTATLESLCDFGTLTGTKVNFDLEGTATDGTYCTNGGKITMSASDVGSVAASKRFTFLANDGLITISGSDAILEPFAAGILAMSDLDSGSDTFPIKISGSGFRVQRQAIVFAPRAGVDVSGSTGSLLCLQAIGQQVKLGGSTLDFGPSAPDCFNPSIDLVQTDSCTGASSSGDAVDLTFTVSNTGNTKLIDVSLTGDGVTLTLSDEGGDGTDVLNTGDSETATSTHTLTQTEADTCSLPKTGTVSGGGVPTGTSVGAEAVTIGTLTSTDVEPESLVAGAVGDVDVSFTVENPVPADGKVVVTFPSGFVLSNGAATAIGRDGTSFNGTESVSIFGRTVTITRSGGNSVATGTAVTLELTNVKNPTTVGLTGTYSIKTTDSIDVTIDQDTSVSGDTMTSGGLTLTNVQPESLVAGATGDVNVSFTLTNPLATGGKIVVIFPSGFTLSNGADTGIGSAGVSFDGDTSVSTSDKTVTITRSGGSEVTGDTAVTLELTNIKNPTVSGSTGTYTIRTTTAAGVTQDQDFVVTADEITPGALTSTNVEPETLTSGDVVDVDVSFTIANPLPANGKIVVTFPSGFTLSSGATTSAGSDGTSFDGSDLVRVSGQSVTISRFGVSQVGTGTAVTLELSNIKNPTTTGSTGIYAIKTTNASGITIDQDTSVSGDSITASQGLTDTASLIEAIAAALALSRTDTVTIGESAATTVERAVTAVELSRTDTGTLGEAIALALELSRTDTASLGEVIVLALELSRSDTASLGEAIALALELSRTDTASLGEAIALALELSRTDTASLGEAIVLALELSRTDTASLGETVAAALALSRTDTASLGESANSAIGKVVTDTTSLGETVAAGLGLSRTDASTLGEVVGLALGLSPTDTANLDEAIQSAISKGVSDTASLEETVAAGLALPRTDAATLGEIIALALGLSPTDTVILDESIQSAIGKGVTDTTSLEETVAAGLALPRTDAATLGEIIALALGLSPTDTVILDDSIQSAIGKGVSDTASLGETVAADLGLSRTDTATLGDAIALALGLSPADAASLDENIQSDISKGVTDTTSLEETVAADLGLSRTDTATLGEAIALALGLSPTDVASLDENIQATSARESPTPPAWRTSLSTQSISAPPT